MKRLLIMMLFLLMWNSNVSAACVGTITASTPTADFTVNGNGTVTHNKTGLMWKQCSEGLSGATCATGTASFHTWQAALQVAETLNNGAGFAGFTDWRVPNIKELASIMEEQCSSPAINATIFPATVMGIEYWSASTDATSTGGAWGLKFGSGAGNLINKFNSNYVRLVRGGQ